jgi:hypothetical protein
MLPARVIAAPLRLKADAAAANERLLKEVLAANVFTGEVRREPAKTRSSPATGRTSQLAASVQLLVVPLNPVHVRVAIRCYPKKGRNRLAPPEPISVKVTVVAV